MKRSRVNFATFIMQHQGCINYDMTLYKLDLDYIHYKFTRIRMYLWII